MIHLPTDLVLTTQYEDHHWLIQQIFMEHCYDICSSSIVTFKSVNRKMTQLGAGPFLF